MSKRYVVRDLAGNFYSDFTSAADAYDPTGATALERAMDWAALQGPAVGQLSVWREDTVTAHQDIKPALIRRWAGQFIFAN